MTPAAPTTNQDIQKLRQLAALGLSQSEMARRMNWHHPRLRYWIEKEHISVDSRRLYPPDEHAIIRLQRTMEQLKA